MATLLRIPMAMDKRLKLLCMTPVSSLSVHCFVTVRTKCRPKGVSCTYTLWVNLATMVKMKVNSQLQFKIFSKANGQATLFL